MKAVLFIDRDGTIITEPPVDFQVDSYDKLRFVPKVIRNLYFIRTKLDYEFALVTNQDGLGTESFPEKDFIGPHGLMMDTLRGEGITFEEEFIDRTFPEENADTRKPGIGMLGKYFSESYDMNRSFVIGDRLTDVLLAKNLGCRAILFQPNDSGKQMVQDAGLTDICAFITDDWDKIAEFLFAGERRACIKRKTAETDIVVEIDLDGAGKGDIQTGLGFFDHMLDQIARHAGIDLFIRVNGDLYVDEHHTIEDTAIVLGEAIQNALGNKRGIERYGFSLPMDDCLCSVALDFGGRSWLVWDASFRREKIGEMPTEMFLHFFKSLSDGARMNLNIQASGENEHHKIEGIFKAFARAMRMAIHRDINKYELPSSKGLL